MFNSNNLNQVNTTKIHTMHKQQKTKLETEIEPSNAVFNNNQLNKKQVFGPQISFNPDNQIKINRVFKKRIQYDCKPYESKSNGISYNNNSNDDIPDENEVYEKKIFVKKEEDELDKGDDIELVNINVSVLFSSENNNSATNNTFQSKDQSSKENENEGSCTLEYSLDSKYKITPSFNTPSIKNVNLSNSQSVNSFQQEQGGRAFVMERVKKMINNKNKHMKTNNDYMINQNTNSIDAEEIEEMYDRVDDKTVFSNIKNNQSQVIIKNNLIAINQGHDLTSSNVKKFKSINRDNTNFKSSSHQIFNYNKSCTTLPSTSSLKENADPNISNNKNNFNVNLINRFNSISHTNNKRSNEPILLDVNSLKVITQKALNGQKPTLKETKITKEEINLNDSDKSSSSNSQIEEILKNYSGSVDLLNKDNKVINIININNTYTIENITVNNYTENTKQQKINLSKYKSTGSKIFCQTPGFGMKASPSSSQSQSSFKSSTKRPTEVKTKSIQQIFSKVSENLANPNLASNQKTKKINTSNYTTTNENLISKCSKYSSTTNAKSNKIDFINFASFLKK